MSILFSFGLGVLLAKFNDLDGKVEKEYQKYKINAPFTYIWLTLCIYHDFGYFCGRSYQKKNDIDKISLKYPIFSYNFCTSRYSKKLYRAYYMKKYKSQNWEDVNNDLNVHEEIGDHGILGGYLLFDQLYSSEQKNNPLTTKYHIQDALVQTDEEEAPPFQHPERIPLYQDICYRIMEHNIWKDYGDESDFKEIRGNNFKKIDISEPLLYLLSLVDTIEMTKKFCKYKDEDEEKEHFVFPKTLGQKVFITVSDDEIEINYRELRKYIQEHQYIDSISDWERSVNGLSQWVEIQSAKTNIEVDIITLKKSGHQQLQNNSVELYCALSK